MATDINNFILSGTDAPEGRASSNPMLDISYGGHGGYIPQIGGLTANGDNFEEYLASSAYIRQPLIPVLLAFPEYMDALPDNSASIKYMFKSIVEKLYDSFDGLNTKVTVITQEHDLGSSQEKMEEVTDVQRARSSISYEFTERAGKGIQRTLNHVIYFSMMHPTTKSPLIRNYLSQDQLRSLYLPNMYRHCTLFIEPDRTFTRCVDAFLGVNMFFKDSGDRGGGRDPQNRTKLVQYSIEVASIICNEDSVIELGQKILTSMSIHSMLPQDIIINPINGIEPSVQSVNSGYDYTK